MAAVTTLRRPELAVAAAAKRVAVVAAKPARGLQAVRLLVLDRPATTTLLATPVKAAKLEQRLAPAALRAAA
jgi:hypothetical protein